MSITNNINVNRNLYSQTGSYGGAPKSPGQPHPSPAAMPEDRVTFSKAALAIKDPKRVVPGILSKDQEISTEEKQVLNDLKRRDTEVKAHETAHMAAGSGIVQGGASYEFQAGPDGKMYAVGGEVQIDVSPGNTPEATIQKMQQVRAAALAPAQPSGTDRAVAAQASQIEAQARIEKTQKDQTDQEIAQSPTASLDPIPAKDVNGPPGSLIDYMA